MTLFSAAEQTNCASRVFVVHAGLFVCSPNAANSDMDCGIFNERMLLNVLSLCITPQSTIYICYSVFFL